MRISDWSSDVCSSDLASAIFDANVSGAQQKAAEAAGSAVSSEAWVAAQLAISTLESDRYDSVSALASLDTLYIRRLNAVAGGEVQGGSNVIAKARADVLAMVDRQNAILDGLQRSEERRVGKGCVST